MALWNNTSVIEALGQCLHAAGWEFKLLLKQRPIKQNEALPGVPCEFIIVIYMMPWSMICIWPGMLGLIEEAGLCFINIVPISLYLHGCSVKAQHLYACKCIPGSIGLPIKHFFPNIYLCKPDFQNPVHNRIIPKGWNNVKCFSRIWSRLEVL